ncbi:MAG: glycosyltransferase family 39 protein, partial [Candidatus Eremiobacteraeota bacterium]|nr:glycosyltransferase family 39 protein [Candidatus Eremiobacteraeota bacterium]
MKLRPISYALAFAAVAMHLAFNHRFGYYRDELYFIDCARHLAWGYVDQPPLVPFVTAMTAPLGYALWAMRVPTAIFSGVTVLFACAIARELRGGTFAQALTGLTVTLAIGFLGLGYALSTEMLSPAVWSALIYLTMLLVKTRNERFYLPIAFVVAFGMYSKYSVAACAFALAVALAMTGSARLLRSRYLLLGVLVVVVALLPNALWQINHGLPMLGVIAGDQLNRHALANGIADESASLGLNAAYFVGTQFAYQNPLYAVFWIAGLVWLTRGVQGTSYRFVAIAYFVLVAIVVLTIGRGYYTEGFYPALFAAGSVATERFVSARAAWWRPATLAYAVLAGVVLAPLALPVLPLAAYMRYEVAIGLSRATPPDGKHHLINPLYAD